MHTYIQAQAAAALRGVVSASSCIYICIYIYKYVIYIYHI